MGTQETRFCLYRDSIYQPFVAYWKLEDAKHRAERESWFASIMVVEYPANILVCRIPRKTVVSDLAKSLKYENQGRIKKWFSLMLQAIYDCFFG